MGGVQRKFSPDRDFKEQIVAEAKKAFDQEVEHAGNANVQQAVRGIEKSVIDRIGQQIEEQLRVEPLELEPGKVGIMPRHFDQTCVRGALEHDEHILFFVHDDNHADDLPNAAEDIAAGFQSANAAYVGNQHLQQLRLTGLRMCLEESHMPNGDCKRICYRAVEGDWSYTGPGIPAGMPSDWHKLVVALSGQIDNGLPNQGSYGNFIETMLRGRRCMSTSDAESPMYCWTCPSKFSGGAAGKMGQWAKDTGNWHVWGYGMTLDRESSGDELRWQKQECNGDPGPWDNFYVVGRVSEAPTSTPAAVAGPTTTIPPSTAAPPPVTAAPLATTVAPPATTAGPSTSLFCFEVMNVHNYELALVRSQLSKGTSVFGCDAWSVFSDEKTWLSPGPPVRIENTVLNIRVEAKAGVSTHFLNTDVFATAWNMIKQEGKYKQHGWTVKVDPDTVFFASRLQDHLRKLPYFPNGVYIQNCLFSDGKYWFFGAVEVISKQAVETYFGGFDVCMRSLDRGELGEDTWLRKCMDMLHISSTQDTGILSDGYCNEAPSPCLSGKAAFHPFKNTDAYFQCFKEAQAQHSTDAGGR